jgi:tRNA-splicing ligase RtcB
MIQWELTEDVRIPVKSWCQNVDEGALMQARNLANLPVVKRYVALMPDAHIGYGMPIGGVIACENAVIPNAVGVDIGCGMGAIETTLNAAELVDMPLRRQITLDIKHSIPVGEGNARSAPLEWEGFAQWQEALDNAELPGWYTPKAHKLDACNLGTLGGGNHFIEIQKTENAATGSNETLWIMLHSGSRNLGARIAEYYHKKAVTLCAELGIALPDSHIAYLPADHELGKGYIRDMAHALLYAAENRRIMMEYLKVVLAEHFPNIQFVQEVNIHHNYAALEEHGGTPLWVHRKGATSARKAELGIIPGSMGTASYIVEGLGNPESFESCSHGAGRCLGRSMANKTLTQAECDAAMEGIVCDRWHLSRTKGVDGKRLPDLSEAPQAYKDIDEVIEAERDLITPLVKLRPLAVVKG